MQSGQKNQSNPALGRKSSKAVKANEEIKSQPWRRSFYLQSLFILLLALAAYWNTLGNKYALDDYVAIVQNNYTQKGFAGIKDLLLKDSLKGYLGEGSEFDSRYYRPLSYVTFAIEIGLWKEKALPKSHFINALLLGLTGVLILGLLRRYLFPERKAIGFLTAFLFVLHPIHTETIANLKGRDEALTFFFMLLSLLAVLIYLEKKNALWLVGGAVCFFLAMLSKENGINLIGILPLVLLVFNKASFKKTAALTGIFIGVAALFLVLRYTIVGFSLANPSADYVGNFYYAASLHEKLATICWVLARYLKMLIFPHPLSWHYYYKEIYYQTFTHPLALVSLLLHLGLGAWALFFVLQNAIKQKLESACFHLKTTAFCILFYLISIFLISNLVVNIGGYVGERFLYQASFGVCLGVALGAVTFLERFKARAFAVYAWAGVFVAVGILLFIQTSRRCKDWKDNSTLFLADKDKCPNSVMGTKAVALTYREMGEKSQDPQEREKYFQLSEQYINHTLKIAPFLIDAWVEKGLLAYARKNLDEEEYCYKQGEKINPKHGNVRNNLAKVYITRAQNAANQNDLKQALSFARKSREYAPNDPAVYSNLGLYFALNQQYDSSIVSYKTAISAAPNNPDYWYGLGWAYYNAQNMSEAAKAWIRTLQIDPNYPQKAGMLPTIQRYAK